jgi:hypothetical protein
MYKSIGAASGLVVIACSSLLTVACGGGNNVEGTYSDSNGVMMLEVRSGGKAALTLMNQVSNCTYTSTDKEIALNCPSGAGELKLARHDDGSLTGPPEGAMPILSKKK